MNYSYFIKASKHSRGYYYLMEKEVDSFGKTEIIRVMSKALTKDELLKLAANIRFKLTTTT